MEYARGLSAVAREGEWGTKMKGGGRGTRNPILGKSLFEKCNLPDRVLSRHPAKGASNSSLSCAPH